MVIYSKLLLYIDVTLTLVKCTLARHCSARLVFRELALFVPQPGIDHFTECATRRRQFALAAIGSVLLLFRATENDWMLT